MKDESSNLPSRADRCCFNHDVQLNRYKYDARDKRACWIHREMYNCMVSKNTAWGKSFAWQLLKCLQC